ncbi:hypothetical protein ABVT39_024581, partial [Epinephelus coioides]
NDTAQRRRKAFDAVRKQLANRGLRPFLRYPATLKVRHNGSLHFFESVADAETFTAMLNRNPRPTSSEIGTPCVSSPTYWMMGDPRRILSLLQLDLNSGLFKVSCSPRLH